MAQSELTRCLRTLESRKLIKSVRSVQAARRKVSGGGEGGREVSGGREGREEGGEGRGGRERKGAREGGRARKGRREGGKARKGEEEGGEYIVCWVEVATCLLMFGGWF